MPTNKDIITQSNLVIVGDGLKKEQTEQQEAKNMFAKAKPLLTTLVNKARDESHSSIARFFGNTDRIKEEDVEYGYNNGIFTITFNNLKDVKSHTKPFLEKLFGKQILLGSRIEDKITVHNKKPSVTIKLTMDEMISFCGTTINQWLQTKNEGTVNTEEEIVKKEEAIDTCKNNIQDKLKEVESILYSNNIVTKTDNFLTDNLAKYARSDNPYAKAVKSKGASGGVEEICKILGKQSKDSQCQAAKTSIENNNIIKDIKKDESNIARLQKDISTLRKTNATTHKQTQSDFCKGYHQKHLDDLIEKLKLSIEALKAETHIPSTLEALVNNIQRNQNVKEALEQELSKYKNNARDRYLLEQSIKKRIEKLKDPNYTGINNDININTTVGILKAMQEYLTNSEIENYNHFVDMYKAATSNADDAAMYVAHNLESNIKLKTDLETEIKSTTKQIALLITEHNDIKLPKEADKDILKEELNKLQRTDESLKAQALKMIDKITVEQKAITANSGSSHSASSQGGNGVTAQSNINIDDIDGGGSQSKLTSVATKTLSDAGNSLHRKNSLSLPGPIA